MTSCKKLRRSLFGCLFAGFISIMLYAHWPTLPLHEGTQVDFIRIEKAAHKLTLYKDNQTLAIYTIALGRSPVGPKTHADDHKTPEGTYQIDFHKKNSAFHRSLHISYPAAKDMNAPNPGGDIMIHGLRNGLGFVGRLHRLFDWTQGCIALTNDEIDQLYNAVPNGTQIEILP